MLIVRNEMANQLQKGRIQDDRSIDEPGAVHFDNGMAPGAGLGDATFRKPYPNPSGAPNLPYVGDDYYTSGDQATISPAVGVTTAPQVPTATVKISGPLDKAPVQKPNTDAAGILAARTNYALGDQSPGVDVLAGQYASGDEAYIRQSASTAEALANRKKRIEQVNQIAQQANAEGRPLSSNEQMQLIGMSQAQFEDPNTILEKKYAARFVTDLTTNEDGQDNLAMEAAAENPVATKDTFDAAQAISERQNAALSLFTKSKQQYDQSSWLRWGWDLGKSLIPLYDYGVMASQLDAMDTSFLGGTNLRDQIAALYLLPTDQFKQKSQEIYDNIAAHSIIDAMTFAKALVSYSTTDAAWDNLMTMLDVASAPGAVVGVAKIAKSAGRAVGVARGARDARLAEPVAEAATAERSVNYDHLSDVAPNTGELKIPPAVTIPEGTPDYRHLAAGAKNTGELNPPPPFKSEDAVASLKDRLKAGLSANATAEPITPTDLLTVAGANEKAAEVKVIDNLTGAAADASAPMGDPKRSMSALLNQQAGMLDPRTYARNAGTMNNQQVARLQETITGVSNNLSRIITDVSVLPRVVNPKAIEQMVKNTRAEWLTTYHNLESAVIEMVPARTSEEAFGGVDQLHIFLGRKDATPFRNREQALLHARDIYRLTPGSYDIVPKSGQYAIRMTKTMDETEATVREFRVATDNPKNAWHQLVDDVLNVTRVNALRTPDDILGKAHTELRKVLTYGGNEAVRYLRNAMKPVGQLTKPQRARLKAILEKNAQETREYTRPDGSKFTAPGNWYETYGDYQTSYAKQFKEQPTVQEVEAYFTLKTVHQWDWFSEQLSALRDKGRLGAELKSVAFVKKGPEGDQLINSDFFEGRTVPKLPDWNTEPFTVAWVDQKGKPQFNLSSKMFKAQRDALEKLVADGKVQVLQPLNANDPILKGMVNTRGAPVQYILSNTVKTKPLSPLQTEYRYGVKNVFPTTGRYLKQANTWRDGFGRRLVGADKTVMHFPIEAQGQKFEKAFNTGREMIRDGVSAQKLAAFVRKNLPYKSGKEFRSLFRDPKVPESRGYDVNTPFVLTKPGQRATDVNDLRAVHKEPLVDLRKSEHNPMASVQSRMPYDNNNGLNTVEEIGTEQNPAYKLTPVQSLDPLSVIQQQAHKLMQNRHLEDYKHSAIEDWAQQFQPVLDIPPSELNANPLQALRNPRFKPRASQPMIAAAQNSRRAILYLIGQNTPVRDAFNAAKDATLNSAYKRMGVKAGDIIDPIEWTATTDPSKMLRGIAFAPKFGFNPVQLYLQAQQVLTAAAIDGNPLRAAQAGSLSMLFRAMRMGDFNPGYNRAIAGIAQRVLGISPDKFMEMYTALRKSGMMNVAGEVSQLDNYFDPKIIGDAKTKVWNFAMIPFTEGERIPRIQGWTTSYLAWRAKNPTAKLTPAVERAITARADIMAGNMTRASNNPVLQGKLTGVISQWSTFFIRIMEQMLSGGVAGEGRLTLAQKARMMLVYSAMYGVPTGTLGITLGPFWNWYEQGEKYALDNSIDLSNPWNRAFFNGFGSLAAEMLTGEDTNFSARFGPGGLTWLRDITQDDDISTLFGPSPGILLSIIGKSEPFTRSLLGVINPGKDDDFPLTAEDILDTFRDIAVVNNIAGGYYAFVTGRLMTQGGLVEGDISKNAAIVKMMLSLEPREISDMWLQKRSLKEIQDAKAVLQNEAKKYFERGLRASVDGNKSDAVANFTKAHTILNGGDYTPLERSRIWKSFMTEKNRSMIDQVGKDWIMKGPPDQRRDRLRQQQEQNQLERGQ
jgi:hypothetical protein